MKASPTATVVDEVRAARARIARAHGYDLRRMFEAARVAERALVHAGQAVVLRPPGTASVAPPLRRTAKGARH